MMSKSAYELASVLVTGAATVHELKTSIATTGIPPSTMDAWLFEALRELVELGLATFLFEPQYGDLPPVSPQSNSTAEFDFFWNRCFADGVSGASESNRTLFIECKDELLHELAKHEYARYEA